MFCFCLIFAPYAHASDSTAVSGIQDRILKELVEIKTLQESTYKQRMKAFEERDKRTADDSPSEYSILHKIRGNTDFNFWKDGCNLLAILAFLASIVTFLAQTATEKHTKNAPLSAQRGKLADLPRHFYRNIVCTGAIIYKFRHSSNGESEKRESYPSESNLLKLQTLPDDVFLPVDVKESSYKVIHELKLLFRNYNMEVMVASEHLSRQHITDEALKHDFDNLLFKPFYLTKRAFEYQRKLSPGIDSQNIDAVKSIINEHFTKLMRPDNLAILLIPRNNSFLKQILDPTFAYFHNNIDTKGSIGRSLEDDNVANSFDKVSISRCNFLSSRNENLQKFIGTLSAEKNEFIKWFNANYTDENGNSKIKDKRATLTPDELYCSLKPYLDYLSCEKWEFSTLLYYMLAVDIAIETDRIGMINY